ncbi:hypothetical protein B0H21DRAFT_701385 [Amylocystis lapponica]|nr:hypothetical protein B0H21DRAFT_701385 [Amylocystis lapponica]
MFTPPPSPVPPRHFQNAKHNSSSLDHPSHAEESDSESGSEPGTPPSSASSASLVPPVPQTLSREQQYVRSLSEKRRIGRRTRWTVLLVPLALIAITLSTRYLTHPAALDVLSPDEHFPDWQEWTMTFSDWRPHKRHPFPDPHPQDTDSNISSTADPSPSAADHPSGTSPSTDSTYPSSTGTTSPSSASSASTSASTTLPTIPASSPVLPTPFPQPWDTSLGQTFSTETCELFFQSMTNDINFRACRPFSLLLQSSSNFIQAQNNLTYLNTVVWGTCNTDISAAQCNDNMASFADTLQDQCETDLNAGNAQVLHALIGLQAYTLMRNAACMRNATTDAYCYVTAAQSTQTADLYIFSLPLGSPLPSSAHSSCSGCSQNLMDMYPPEIANLTSLQQTYADAAQLMNSDCGAGYVQSVAVDFNAALRFSDDRVWLRAISLAAVGVLLTMW